ncbi:hypothetical protein [Lacrimispora sp.]|uniref:hypothetical protein n=1 Tax=Lacrimispora sp. TaxID=2719234 RepID=UPI00345FF0CE
MQNAKVQQDTVYGCLVNANILYEKFILQQPLLRLGERGEGYIVPCANLFSALIVDSFYYIKLDIEK